MKFKKKKLVRLLRHVKDEEKEMLTTPIRVGKTLLYGYWLPSKMDQSVKITLKKTKS